MSPHTDEIDRYEEQGNTKPPKNRWTQFILVALVLIGIAIILFSCGN